MQLGMIGLGRMGSNMTRRLLRGGHSCVVYDQISSSIEQLTTEGAIGADAIADLVNQLTAPRTVWLMVPAANVDETIHELKTLLEPGDTIVDGGNSHYVDDIRRAGELTALGFHYLDVGTSGGVWGLERGYCLMGGGERQVFEQLLPILQTLSPGGTDQAAAAEQRPGSTAPSGYVYCGPAGAGHFVKMVHNGIEYGLMAAYAEGLNILRHANIGRAGQTVDAETAPIQNPTLYQFDFDLAEITEVWRHGSVVASWLLDLTASALAKDTALTEFTGHVADSGEGRWTLTAAIDESVPAPVLSAALYQRFDSRGNDEYAEKVLSAMRYAFGGHVERSRAAR